MAVDERRRNALFQAVARALGEDPAVTMFELLPPPETDLATTADLDALEERLGARIDALASRIDGVDARLGARIDGVDARIDGLEQGIDRLGETIRTEMSLQREELLAAFRGELMAAISGQTRGIIVALTVAVITGVVGISGVAITLSQLL
jgi:hypothetical protein